MEEREEPGVLNCSNDDTEFSNLEIPELYGLELPSSFDWDESDIPVDFRSDRETLLNAQPVNANERELGENLDVLPSYSDATTRRTIGDDTEENKLSFYPEDFYSGHEENFENRLSASSNSLGNKNCTEISSWEKQVPNYSSYGTFYPNLGITLDISPSDSFVTAQGGIDVENCLNEPFLFEPSDPALRNPGRISDNELYPDADLTLQNPDRCHYSGYMSQERPNSNDIKRSLSFKYSPDKRIRRPGYLSFSETDYALKTTPVGSKTQNTCVDSIEKNKNEYFRGFPALEEFTNVSRRTNAETENKEPQLSGNGDAFSVTKHSGIFSDSLVSKNLGSGEDQNGSPPTLHPKLKEKLLFYCDKKYTRKDKLKKHLLTHNEETTPGNEELKMQVQTHTSRKSFKCDECGKFYSSKSNLIKHRRIHTGEKPFECEFCKRRFRQNSHLQDHLWTHAGEKSLECEVCQRRFVKSSDLQNHLLTHSEKKGVKCEQCGKSYSSNEELEAHLKTTGKKSNQCRVCYKYFSSKCSLNTHRQMHWGQKTAVCEFCKKGFVDKIYLGKHIQICPKKRPFKCNKCGEEFANENDLENHIRTHNPI